MPIDPSYGKVRFRKTQLWINEKYEPISKQITLENHMCSSEELGLSGENAKFWPLANNSLKTYLGFIQKAFYCVD